MDLQKLEQIKALRAKYRVGDTDEKGIGDIARAAVNFPHHVGRRMVDAGKVIRTGMRHAARQYGVEEKRGDPDDPARSIGNVINAGVRGARAQQHRNRIPVVKGRAVLDSPTSESPKKPERISADIDLPVIHTRGGKEGARAVMGELQKQGNVGTRGRGDVGKARKYRMGLGNPYESNEKTGSSKGRVGRAIPENRGKTERYLLGYSTSPSKPNVKPTAADFTSSADKPVDIPEKLDVHSEHRGGDVTRSGGEIHRLESAPQTAKSGRQYQREINKNRPVDDDDQKSPAQYPSGGLPKASAARQRMRQETGRLLGGGYNGLQSRLPEGPPSPTRSTQPSPVQEGQKESGSVLEGEQTEGTKKSAKTRGKGKKVNTPESDAYNKLHARGHAEATKRGSYVAPYPVRPVENEEYLKRTEKPETPSPVFFEGIPGLVEPGPNDGPEAWKAFRKKLAAHRKAQRGKKKSFGDVKEKAMDIDTKAAKKPKKPEEPPKLEQLPPNAIAVGKTPLTPEERKRIARPKKTTGSTKREIPRGTANLGPMARKAEETPEQIAAINAANAEIERAEREKKKPKVSKVQPKVYPAVTPSSGSSTSRLVSDPGVLNYNREHLEAGQSRGKPKPVAYSPHVTDAPTRNVQAQRARMRGVPDDSGATRFQSQRGVPQAGGIGRSRAIQQRATAGPMSSSQLSEIGLRGRAESGKMKDTANKFEGMSISRGQARAASEAGTTQRGRTRSQIDKDNWEAGIPKGPSTTDKIKAKLGQKPAAPVNTYGTYGPHLMGNPDQRTAHKARNIKVDYGAHKHMTIQNKADSFADRIGLVKAARLKTSKDPSTYSVYPDPQKTQEFAASRQRRRGRNFIVANREQAMYGDDAAAPVSTGVGASGARYAAPQERVSRGGQEIVGRGGQEIVGRGGAARPMRSIGQERVYPNFAGTQISREQARRMGHADITHTSGKHLSDDQTRAEKFMGRLARKNQDKSNNPGSLGAAGGLESMASLI